MKPTTPLTPEQIKIGRLERKLRREQDRSAMYKEQLKHYRTVLSDLPYLERMWERHQTRMREWERYREIAQRNREQAALIERLQKELGEKND